MTTSIANHSRAHDARDHSSNLIGLEEVYKTYWGDLCRHLKRAFGAGPPEPEDVAQAAFTKLAAIDDLAKVVNPRAFLITTSRNIVVDYHRRQARHSAYARQAVVADSAFDLDHLSPERVLIQKERLEIVRRAIQDLPHKQRLILGLHRNRGLTYQQIVAETGWSYGDVYRQMQTALATLAAALKQ